MNNKLLLYYYLKQNLSLGIWECKGPQHLLVGYINILFENYKCQFFTKGKTNKRMQKGQLFSSGASPSLE